MTNYAKRLTDHLAARGVAVEEWPTGGGCSALATADGRFLMTNGDAGLPDNSDPYMQALVSEYDEEGTEEVAYREFRQFDTPDHLAGAIAGWINSRN